MKKAILFFTTFGLLFFASGFSGCGDDVYVWTSDESYNDANNSYDNKSKEFSLKLLSYISDKNENGLKSMFSVIIVAEQDFEKQVQGAFEFFEGEIIDCDSITGLIGSSGEKRQDGRIVDYNITPQIKNIQTDIGKTYSIRYCAYLIAIDYVVDGKIIKMEDRLGISEIIIEDDDGNEFVIGDFYLVNPEWQ
jgi:hypothetical protein